MFKDVLGSDFQSFKKLDDENKVEVLTSKLRHNNFTEKHPPKIKILPYYLYGSIIGVSLFYILRK